MKMLNKVETSKTPRWDMMTEVTKMQVALNRMYDELNPVASRAENDALIGAICNLNFLKMKLNNNRTGELDV